MNLKIVYSIKPQRKNLNYYELLGIQVSQSKKLAAQYALANFRPARRYTITEQLVEEMGNGCVLVKKNISVSTISKKELESIAD